MASDESMIMFSSTQEEEFDGDDDNTDDGFDHLPQFQNLSRLSVCTSSAYTNELDRDVDDEDMRKFLSRLSIENLTEEFPDEKNTRNRLLDISSDEFSDKVSGFRSLPATPPRRRRRAGKTVGSSSSSSSLPILSSKYASENEGQNGKKTGRRRSGNSKNQRGYRHFSGESEGGGSGGHGAGGGGVVVITRPKGGKTSLCMDMEEVQACEDLGFELEHERMLDIPNRVSIPAGSPTSSGSNSPIANWRISSPGDDPRDVKARLKVWAQAVALTCTSKHAS